MNNNNVQTVGQKITIVFIAVSIILFFTCLCIRVSTNRDYIITKGNAVVNSWGGAYGAPHTRGAEDKLSKLETTRTLCVVGMVASGILLVACLFIYPATKKKQIINEANISAVDTIPSSNSTDIHSQLSTLNELYASKLITEEEFIKKKTELLNKL